MNNISRVVYFIALCLFLLTVGFMIGVRSANPYDSLRSSCTRLCDPYGGMKIGMGSSANISCMCESGAMFDKGISRSE